MLCSTTTTTITVAPARAATVTAIARAKEMAEMAEAMTTVGEARTMAREARMTAKAEMMEMVIASHSDANDAAPIKKNEQENISFLVDISQKIIPILGHCRTLITTDNEPRHIGYHTDIKISRCNEI